MKSYAAYYNNPARMQSSSGGIFTILALQFDVIYGVAMTDNCYEAQMIRTVGDLSSIRSSKYIQAKMGDSYRLVKKDLQDGYKVLFSGTGCQINGLKCYLKNNYENLVCVDVICHGVPSPKLWSKYVKAKEQKNGKLVNVNFRCKTSGWKNFGMKENHEFVSKDLDPYMQMFLRDYSLRPSCYQCYAKKYKLADITIGDFWGIENVAPELDDGMGTSLVIIRSDKGQELFYSISSELIYKEIDYKAAINNNDAEYKSKSRPKERDSFFKDMNRYDFETLNKMYVHTTTTKLILNRIKRGVRTVLRKCGGIKDNN